jgi:hypothetical protein
MAPVTIWPIRQPPSHHQLVVRLAHYAVRHLLALAFLLGVEPAVLERAVGALHLDNNNDDVNVKA